MEREPSPETLEPGPDGRCPATTKAGERCAWTVDLNPVTGLCVHHDPDRSQVVRERRLKGGRVAGSRVKVDPHTVLPEPRTLDDVLAWASWVARATALGTLDPKRACEINKSLGVLRGALKERDVERRVRELERELRRKGRAPSLPTSTGVPDDAHDP